MEFEIRCAACGAEFGVAEDEPVALELAEYERCGECGADDLYVYAEDGGEDDMPF